MMTPQSFLFVFAHPDDEVSFSGMVLECLRAKHRVTFVCATNGQARLPQGETVHFRKRQMEEAAKRLGVDHLIFLDLEDGSLATGYDFLKIEEKIAEIIQKTQPNIIATFPPDGITRHPDHLVIHQLTKRAFFSTREPHRHQELHYWCRGHEEFLQTFLKKPPYELLQKNCWKLEKVVPTITLDVRHHFHQKLQALYCHEGQRLIRYLRELSEEKQKLFLGYEYFYSAFSNGL